MFNFWQILHKRPALGCLLFIGMLGYTGPKVWQEAKIRGLVPGYQRFRAMVVSAYERQAEHQALPVKRLCFVVASDSQATYETQVPCKNVGEFTQGASIELYREGRRVESLAYASGRFGINLILLMTELFAVAYYVRRLRFRRGEDPAGSGALS